MKNPYLVWAVGDGANGSQESIKIGSMIQARHPDHFIYLGDVYPAGEPASYTTYYEQAYGPMKSVTYAIPGNHDHMTGLQGYKMYWPHLPAYYNAKIGNWLFFFLDSELDHGPGSDQVTWMKGQLALWNGPVVLCFHRSRWSVGGHGDQPDTQTFLDALGGRPAMVLTGHNHSMQAFKPVDGVVQIVAGSGGQSAYPVGLDPRVDFSLGAYGALKLLVYTDHIKYSLVDINAHHRFDAIFRA